MAKNENINDWRRIAARISVETDSKKLTELIQQLSVALDREDSLPGSGGQPGSQSHGVDDNTNLHVLCCICKQPVRLTFGTVADEDGQAVHEFCYAKRITDRTPRNNGPFPH